MMAVTGGSPDVVGRALRGPPLGREDHMVILGDSGVFEPRRDFSVGTGELRKLPCPVLFLDGETDDYDAVGDQPSFPWNGGLVHTVSRDVTMLCRGEVFRLHGKTVLAFGGASTPGRDDVGKYWSWWPDQDPDGEDLERALSNVDKVGGKVDVVLSCDCPESWKDGMPGSVRGLPSGRMCQRLLESIDYGRWVFSRRGLDLDLPEVRASCVGSRVLPL